jgi:hypothetical protein
MSKPSKGAQISQLGWAITRLVYGTFFCLILLFILFEIARSAGGF